MLRRVSQLGKWHKKKVAELEATGWRRHGLQVGDKVRFHCEGDYEDDELWEEILGEERNITMKIAHGEIGEIVHLGAGDRVTVRLTCTCSYHDDKDKSHIFTDEGQELQGDIVTKDEAKDLCWEWGFLAIESPKPKHQTIPMFD